MTIDKITQKFLTNPGYLENGAGKLGKSWGVSIEKIKDAKKQARRIIKADEQAQVQNSIAEDEEKIAKYIGSTPGDDGVVKKFQSPKPLTPKELEELSGVDGINTFIARTWDKLQTNGIWTYSIDIRFKIKDFYSKEELKEKLKELFPDLKALQIPKIPLGRVVQDKLLTILLADDHAGAVSDNLIFDSEKYTIEVYKARLLKVVEEVKKLGLTFDEVVVISLGDQLNGWNSQTTRGGHEVKSVSNKDQFDMYVIARRAFYDALFSSNITDSYTVYDVENSNHSGMGLSYMANQYLDVYLESKYPDVVRESVHTIIDGFDYGQHLILMTHGKDEKIQKRPLPFNLNEKTDLLIYDYAQNKGYSPYDTNITFYKGDLHQYGIQMGRFGRYINVPPIIGNMDYSDINFGNSKAGALLEIFDRDSSTVQSQTIWF